MVGTYLVDLLDEGVVGDLVPLGVVVVDVDLHDEGAVVAVGVEARHESGAALALRRHALLPVGAVATIAALCQGTKVGWG